MYSLAQNLAKFSVNLNRLQYNKQIKNTQKDPL